MNILLVDDDNLVLQELKEILKKQELPFEKIFMASCIEEAKKLLRTVPVQVMLCDIEMPGGSGLLLLEWVRKEGFFIQCIFLTNYADFSYARQAISLDSLEYLLKPAEPDQLKDIVKKAMKRAMESRQYEQARKYWLDNGREARETFWRQHLMEGLPLRKEHLKRLGYEEEDCYLQIVLKAVSLSDVEKLWGEDMFEYVLKNVMFELLDTPWFQGESVFCTHQGIWTAICRFSLDAPPDAGSVEEALEGIEEACREKLHCEVVCGLGYVCSGELLKKQLEQLVEMMENLLEKKESVLRFLDYQPKEYVYQTPDVSIWETFLEERKKDALKKDIRRYVEQKASEGWNKQQMQAFRQDITQMFYSCLSSAGIMAHKLIAGEGAERLYQRSLNSVRDMCLYCDSLADEVIGYLKFMEEPSSVMDKILRYVEDHYCEEISRSELADLVYISNDYCSRIFKRETGQSIAQYILDKRMEKARKLLESDLSVKNVAMQVGYSNFSYFSKVFKETAGMTPMEYRQKCC